MLCGWTSLNILIYSLRMSYTHTIYFDYNYLSSPPQFPDTLQLHIPLPTTHSHKFPSNALSLISVVRGCGAIHRAWETYQRLSLKKLTIKSHQ